MYITIADKGLVSKPGRTDAGRYFANTTFTTYNIDIEDLEQYIGNGYTITYLYRDNQFKRKKGYAKNNYIGTQLICVDVDECDTDPDTFVSNIKYKPTIYHTTFSNLTEAKHHKYCFHLLYCFEDIVWGECEFNQVFNEICKDYQDYVDTKARDCHRCIYTSNSSLKNFIYHCTNITYHISDFIEGRNDDTSCSYNCLRFDSFDITPPSPDLIRKAKNRQRDMSFNLDDSFRKDLYTLSRKDFIEEYSNRYPYNIETFVDGRMYEDGYADLRDIDFFRVPSSKYWWNSEKRKPEIPKVKIGHRDERLWLDALCFIMTTPNITMENLVYCLVRIVWERYDNSDKQLTNRYIIQKAEQAFRSIGCNEVKPMKKSFKIDKDFWISQGENDWLNITRKIRKTIKDKDFSRMYDKTLTLEKNLDVFHSNGFKTKKCTLIKWLEENHYEYTTEKELRDRFIIDMYEKNRELSFRELEIICKDNNIKVNKDTIRKVIDEHKSVSLTNDCLDIAPPSPKRIREEENKQNKINQRHMKTIDTFEIINGKPHWTFTLNLTDDEIKEVLENGRALGKGRYGIENLSPYAKNNEVKHICWKASIKTGGRYAIDLMEYM